MGEIREIFVMEDRVTPVLDEVIQKMAACYQVSERMTSGQRRIADAFSSSSASAYKMAQSVNMVETEVTQADKASKGFTSTLKNLYTAALGLFSVKAITGLSDEVTEATARLKIMTGSAEDAAAAQDEIYKAAMRSRGSYTEMADTVSKIGMLAGEAFESTGELVAFVEQLNKQMAISGAGAASRQAAMLQLTQGLSSGALRGEELNSILEQTPLIAKTIADYLHMSTGEMRDFASEGRLSAEIVKNAMLSATAVNTTNENFKQTPITWAQLWTMAGNVATRALDPLLSAVNFLANNMRIIGPLVLSVGAAFAVFQIAANWTKIASAAAAVYHGVVNFLSIGFGVLTGSTAASSAAVFTFNSALLASPVTWVAMGVLLLVGALYAGVAAFNKLTGSSVSATGIIAGTFYTLLAFLFNTVLVPIQNKFAAFANFLANLFVDPVTAIKVLMYDMAITVMGYIQSIAGGIESLINAIPGVEVDLTSKIGSIYDGLKANREAAIASGSYKEYVKAWDYMDLGESFSKGYNWGSNLFSGSNSIFSMAGVGSYSASDFDVPTYDQMAGISDSVGNIEKTVAMSQEDIKSLVDVAERRYVNNINLTSQTPVINVTGQNTGNTAADRQNLANALRDILLEQVASGTTRATGRAY